LLLSHCHFDHMLGLPVFAPAFVAGNRLRLWAGHLLPHRRLHDVIGQMMASPLYPKRPDIFEADMDFCDFRAGDTLPLAPALRVRTAPLNHHDGATGYRIEHGGKVIAYVTDTEHRAGSRDPNVLALARDADLMIYDSNYTDEEYPAHVGWGHST